MMLYCRSARRYRLVIALALLFAMGVACNQKPEPSPDDQVLTKDPTESASDELAKPASDTSSRPSTSQFSTVTREATSKAVSQFVNPDDTDWLTESFSEAANGQLSALAAFLAQADKADNQRVLDNVFTASAKTTPLRPDDLREIFRDEGIVVKRLDQSTEIDPTFTAQDMARQFLGANGDADKSVKLKVFRVEPKREGFSTLVAVEAAQRSTDANLQINATWSCVWTARDDAPPRIQSVTVTAHEEVTSRPADRWMTDCTESVLGQNKSYQRQFLVGTDAWVNRLDRRLTISRFGHHGLALADVNGDGREDLYVCQPGGLPNRLFLQQPDGAASDVSAEAGIDFLDYTSSAIFVDLDNDADQDLIVASIAALTVWMNDGEGHFEPAAAMTECPTANSLAVADYDGDGLLDIYACRYRARSRELGQFPLPIPYYDANNGGRNHLYRNLGNGRFADVTKATGLSANNTRFSYAAAWEDYDNDGDVDLYVANDFGRNCLYQNNQGRFRDVAASAGVEDIASGMSVSWADFDHDGHIDLYVSNMFSSAGNRITYQERLVNKYSADARAHIQRHARGNTLFRNLGDGTFEDVSLSAKVTLGRWAWGSLFADINNDGWDDLLVANGLITTSDTGDL